MDCISRLMSVLLADDELDISDCRVTTIVTQLLREIRTVYGEPGDIFWTYWTNNVYRELGSNVRFARFTLV